MAKRTRKTGPKLPRQTGTAALLHQLARAESEPSAEHESAGRDVEGAARTDDGIEQARRKVLQAQADLNRAMAEAQSVLDAAGPRCPSRLCGRPLDAESLMAGRCAHCKVLVHGHQINREHGRYARTPPELTDTGTSEAVPAAVGSTPSQQVSVSTAASTYRAQLEADQGGPDDLPAVTRAYCQRLVELEALLRSIAANLSKEGVFTSRGRPRSALNAYLATVGTWDRVAIRLGLTRRPKDVTPPSPLDWMNQPAQGGAHAAEPAPSAGSDADRADQQTDEHADAETDRTVTNDERE